MTVRIWLFATALLALPLAGHADDAKTEEAETRRERLTALTAEYRAGLIKQAARLREIRQEFRDQGRSPSDLTDEEDKKFKAELAKLAPDRTELGNKIAAIMNEEPSDDVAFDCARWLLQNGITGQPGSDAVKALHDHHVARSQIASLCPLLASLPNGQELLAAIVEKNPHANVQGAALFAQAEQRGRLADLARRLQDPQQVASALSTASVDAETIAHLRKADPAEIEREAEKLFERAAQDYASVKLRNKTIGELAEAELFEIRHLGIGKVAADIEGEDTDGVPFKLSDYRGKVVVLDFWGHW